MEWDPMHTEGFALAERRATSMLEIEVKEKIVEDIGVM